jgi:hypothetical protein
MSVLLKHVNGVSADLFGELTEDTAGSGAVVVAPVLATPAVALGVAVGAVAFHAGYMIGIVRNMAEGKHTKPK